MDRIQQKELQKLKEQKLEKQKKQMQAVKTMMKDEAIKIVFDYCHRILSQPLTQSLSDYAPSYLSKFVFDEHLQKAKLIFESLPNQQCTIQHFILMMISIMDFPFEKWPYFIVGIKDMFYEIAQQKSNIITFQNFFKYIIGEVLDFKVQQQNTQFQVRFEQLKKQDFLLHDTGIKKFYYSHDTKLYMTLDQSSPAIKIYNKQMRQINRFIPNKQRHNKKFPNIIHFDYSEMTDKLGLLLANNTFSLINFQNFLNKSKFQFELNPTNEMVINLQQKMRMVIYLQMLNRWALISENNKLYTFEVQRYKQNDTNYISEIKMQNPDLQIVTILQLVNLSMICVVTGNQVHFYNQSLTQKKHAKFSHSNNIKIFTYCQQLGMFYLCGQQKFITILTLIRNTNNFSITTFDIQSKHNICAFQLFPAIGTIITVDTNNEVKSFDIWKGTCYQLVNYTSIVKNSNYDLKMLKISKTQFALYETYVIVFNQQKIAIEKDTQFTFVNRTYFDRAKQEFYFSVNNQIISFSLCQGEIRKCYNHETANIPKHQSFFIGKSTQLFILDCDKNIYEPYLKDQVMQGQNRNYKKKISIQQTVNMFYDEQICYAFVLSPNTIHTVRNDKQNNFTITSSLSISKYPLIVSACYNARERSITALTNNQCWMVIDTQNYKLLQYFKYNFPIDPNEHEEIMIQQFEQDETYNLDIILNNKNQLYFVSREDRNNKVCIKITDILPYKLKNLQFTNLKYCPLTKMNKIYVLLTDKTGYILEINLTKILSNHFKQSQCPIKQFKFPVKDLHNLQNFNNQQPKNYYISSVKLANVDKANLSVFKGHDKQIKIFTKFDMEGIKTLTMSVDGHIKMWESQDLLFHLKLPDLKKIIWNMEKIQKVRTQRSVSQILLIFNKIANLSVEKPSPQLLLKKNHQKFNQQTKQVKKFNIDEPIQLQIQNKDIEDIVQKTHNINWYSLKSQSKRSSHLWETHRVSPHPWRTKNQFKKIMEKASPQNKYKKKMPLDLILLRNSLDMKDKTAILNKNHTGELVILPQLNNYVPQKKLSENKQKQIDESEYMENQEAFESCLYIKKNINRKKINQFDEIDKQFKKKWLNLTTRKFIPKSQNKKGSQTERKSKNKVKDMKSMYISSNITTKYDAIKQIKNLFQAHNRDASLSKKGRLIKIPQISLKREEMLFYE